MGKVSAHYLEAEETFAGLVVGAQLARFHASSLLYRKGPRSSFRASHGNLLMNRDRPEVFVAGCLRDCCFHRPHRELLTPSFPAWMPEKRRNFPFLFSRSPARQFRQGQ